MQDNDMITKTMLVKGSPEELYRLWANFENFPHFMKNLKSVEKTGERTSHWVMSGPLGTEIAWDAETTRMEDNKRIAWNSLTGDIKTSGQVTFNGMPNNQTEVTLMLKYVPPAGMAANIASWFMDNPEDMVEEDLKNFKAYAEQMLERTNSR